MPVPIWLAARLWKGNWDLWLPYTPRKLPEERRGGFTKLTEFYRRKEISGWSSIELRNMRDTRVNKGALYPRGPPRTGVTWLWSPHDRASVHVSLVESRLPRLGAGMGRALGFHSEAGAGRAGQTARPPGGSHGPVSCTTLSPCPALGRSPDPQPG